MHISQVFHLMRFDKDIHMCDPNSYQDIEYYHYSRKFCSKSSPTSTPHIQDVIIMVMFFTIDISFILFYFLVDLHISEFNICILFLFLASFTLHNVSEIHPCCYNSISVFFFANTKELSFESPCNSFSALE